MPKKWIVGLGNPGKKYENTRHNAGFLFIDFLSMNWDAGEEKKGYESLYQEIRDPDRGNRVFLVSPQTFMNDSGRCIAQWKRREGLEAADLLVVYDDMDLPLGKVRYRASGSGGSHNGMASIIESLGTSDFARLRFGVGKPDNPEDWADYVLRPFRPEEHDHLAQMMEKGREAAVMWLKGEPADLIMSRVNGTAE